MCITAARFKIMKRMRYNQFPDSWDSDDGEPESKRRRFTGRAGADSASLGHASSSSSNAGSAVEGKEAKRADAMEEEGVAAGAALPLPAADEPGAAAPGFAAAVPDGIEADPAAQEDESGSVFAVPAAEGAEAEPGSPNNAGGGDSPHADAEPAPANNCGMHRRGCSSASAGSSDYSPYDNATQALLHA